MNTLPSPDRAASVAGCSLPPEALALPADEMLRSPEGIEHALVPVFIYDTENLAILAANAEALRLYGYGAEEFLRLTILDICPPEDVARISNLLADGWPPGLRYAGIWRHKAKDGRVLKVNIISMNIVHDGRAARVAIVSDLTPAMYAPGPLPEFERLMFPFAEQMHEVAWIRSVEDGRLVYVNPALERVFGIPREAAYADPGVVSRMVHPEDAEAFQRYKQAQKTGPASVEYRIRRPDGALRWISARCFPLLDASGERMVAGTSKDVTERKDAEQRRLDAAAAQRDALVREVHHRIKNNLQGITGMLRQLAAAHPELRPAMGQAISQVQTVAVIHGLQSRTAAGQVALCELVPSIAASVESLMRGRFSLDVAVSRSHAALVCEAEAVAVALLLNELMVNAVKHGSAGEGRAIRVALGGEGARAEVRIVNPGRLAAGFDFSMQKGTGVGLQLVRSLLPREGARLSIGNCADGVETLLSLEPPVVSMGQISEVRHEGSQEGGAAQDPAGR